MKIALIGNMNNNFFALSRFLRDLDLKADLFLMNNEEEHFMPESDTYDLSHRDFTYKLNFGNRYWFLNEVEELGNCFLHQLQKLREYDFIIACGGSIAYLEYFNIAVDIFIPYGSDIYELPFFVPSANPNHRKHLDQFSIFQSRGIKKVKNIITTHDFYYLECYSEGFERLHCKDKVKSFYYFPFVYDDIYVPWNIVDNFCTSYWHKEFAKIRKNSDLILFSHARQAWINADKQTQKGNDVLIRAFARIVKKMNYLSPVLILYEYGPDVAFSKELIRQLNIEKFVVWMPKMNRKDIMVGLFFSDIVCDTFAIGYTMGGVIAEAIIAHKPLLSYIKNEFLSENGFKNLNAKNVEEIVDNIENYMTHKSYYQEIINNNYRLLQSQRDEALKYIIGLIESKGK